MDGGYRCKRDFHFRVSGSVSESTLVMYTP